MEFNHVIGENRRAADPLSVNLTPTELSPAGIRNAHVQFAFLYLLPILRGYDMAERMMIIVRYHLRHAGRSRSEVNLHHVGSLGRLVTHRPLERIRELHEFLIKVDPALTLHVVNNRTVLYAGHLGSSELHLLHNIFVVHAHEHLYARGIGTVRDILLRELKRSGNHDDTELDQSHRANPVLPTAAENQHDYVALLQTERLEIVRRPIA